MKFDMETFGWLILLIAFVAVMALIGCFVWYVMTWAGLCNKLAVAGGIIVPVIVGVIAVGWFIKSCVHIQ